MPRSKDRRLAKESYKSTVARGAFPIALAAGALASVLTYRSSFVFAAGGVLIACTANGGAPDNPRDDQRVRSYVVDTIRDLEGDKPTIMSASVHDTTLTLVVNPVYEPWWQFLNTASPRSLSPQGIATPAPQGYADVPHGLIRRGYRSWNYWLLYVAVFENALREVRHFGHPIEAQVRLVNRKGNLIYRNVDVRFAGL